MLEGKWIMEDNQHLNENKKNTIGRTVLSAGAPPRHQHQTQQGEEEQEQVPPRLSSSSSSYYDYKTASHHQQPSTYPSESLVSASLKNYCIK